MISLLTDQSHWMLHVYYEMSYWIGRLLFHARAVQRAIGVEVFSSWTALILLGASSVFYFYQMASCHTDE